MKKRIVCVLLTLIMLLSLVPMGASAASMAVSERAITVLKQLQVYSNVCTAYGNEYRIGYGTICTCTKGAHGGVHADFNEKVADTALRAKLKELDAAVNSFASNAGVSLTQGQHDALVVHSYDRGTAWMSGTGVLRSAVVNGLSGNAFLNAIGQTTDTGSASRRMVEANMYLNGAYSNIAPSNYSYVVYNADGGTMAEGNGGRYTQYFDGLSYITPSPVPTRNGYIFLGWYDGNAWVPYLTNDQAAHNLVAKWQAAGARYNNAASVNYWLDVDQLASTKVYNTPDVDDAEGSLDDDDDDVRLDRDYIDGDGARWSRLYGGNGWVLVDGTPSSTPGSSGFEIDVIVTVTNSYVRSRQNATIYSTQNGTYNQGDQLRIVNTANADGYLWGQVANSDDETIGWVALMYTDWNSVKDSNNSNSSKAIATAVVNCDGYLNVRSEAGTENAIVGALADGDTVDIFEIKFVNGHQWGRTTGGWILLTYAKVTMLDTNVSYINDADVLAYTFTGTLKNRVTPRADAADNAAAAGDALSAGTLVAVGMVKNDTNGNIWGFNGTGWIKLSDINMDIAKYVVIANSVTVRALDNNGNISSGNVGVEKLVKGVELDISEIKVVDATIWGYTAKYDGWVNLASKYVQRSNAPIIENVEENGLTGLVATVINTDSVRVRNYGDTYGTQIGSLSRGVTVLVWDQNEDTLWYKVDHNQNGIREEEIDGWVSNQYLDVYEGTIGGDDSNGSTSGNTSGSGAVETGIGIVANTYSGVNVRTGAGTGNAAVGKMLPGTAVEILEVTTHGTSKWGRTAQGWVCMDYITMVSKYPIGDAIVDTNTNSSAGQNSGGSTSNTEGNTTTVSTPAVYTGYAINDISVLKAADEDAQTVRNIRAGEQVTIQELVSVTTKKVVSQGSNVDGNATTETTTTVTSVTYWARVNDGWIADPEDNLGLDALDEITYTVTGANEINVRTGVNGTIVTTLDKGTQVTITNLRIADDKVWGHIEDLGTNGGWVRLDNLSEGAITIKDESAPTTPSTPPVVMGNGSNTGGFVENTSGYRYTGKVIRANEVNVRATPSTAATKTTSLKSGAALVIYETTIAENMAWGRCDAGWVYLYYVDLAPVVNGAVDARVVYNDNTIIYSDVNGSAVAGTYARMSTIDIYEIVGKMARTDKGWVNTDNLL